MNLCIIIPAYNEALRIEKTVREYFNFFHAQPHLKCELMLVLNGCTDATYDICLALQAELGSGISIIRTPEKGKGRAIKVGFHEALCKNFNLIGFVDADMATRPFYFFDLVRQIGCFQGVIASRYMPNSQIYPPRPLIKRWGSKLIYERLVKKLLGIHFYDFQCGAKVFTRDLILQTIDHLTVNEWAMDIELLYVAHKLGFKILEQPTVWYDQKDSKLTLSSGLRMLYSIFHIWFNHRTIKPLSSN